MRMWLSEIAQIFSSSWPGEDKMVTGISTDSRSTRQGELFVALTGNDFDGHDFIDQAFSRGAVAAIVSKTGMSTAFNHIEVKDTLKALGQLARYWHRYCQSENGQSENGQSENKEKKSINQTIAVTGSVGKTTVKEMINTMLCDDVSVCTTKGNFNNAIGLPLTLFNESPEDSIAIIEMGANAAGEIKALCDIASPDIGIITQIAEAHLEGFNDIEGIARAKAELFSALSETGTAILNADVKCMPVLLSAASHCHLIQVALVQRKGIDVWAEDIHYHPQCITFNYCWEKKKLPVRLSLSGQHNILNALLAITGIIALGFEAVNRVKFLANMAEIPGRLNSHITKYGGLVIDDSYNANPASVRAAIDYLETFPQRKILVLGNMGELGANELALHAECGEYAASHGIDAIYCLGDLASEACKAFNRKRSPDSEKNQDFQKHEFHNKEQLVKHLEKEIGNKSTILIKGSRAAKMEQVVQSLLDADDTYTNNYKIKEECL